MPDIFSPWLGVGEERDSSGLRPRFLLLFRVAMPGVLSESLVTNFFGDGERFVWRVSFAEACGGFRRNHGVVRERRDISFVTAMFLDVHRISIISSKKRFLQAYSCLAISSTPARRTHGPELKHVRNRRPEMQI